MIKLQFKLPQALTSRGFTRRTVFHAPAFQKKGINPVYTSFINYILYTLFHLHYVYFYKGEFCLRCLTGCHLISLCRFLYCATDVIFGQPISIYLQINKLE